MLNKETQLRFKKWQNTPVAFEFTVNTAGIIISLYCLSLTCIFHQQQNSNLDLLCN